MCLLQAQLLAIIVSSALKISVQPLEEILQCLSNHIPLCLLVIGVTLGCKTQFQFDPACFPFSTSLEIKLQGDICCLICKSAFKMPVPRKFGISLIHGCSVSDKLYIPWKMSLTVQVFTDPK